MDSYVKELLKEINFKGIDIDSFSEKILNNGVSKIGNIFDFEAKNLENQLKKKLSKKDFDYFVESYRMEISKSVLLKHLLLNLKKADIWSQEISFNFSKKSKELENIFVDIDLFLSPLKNRLDVNEKVDTIKSSTISDHLTKNIIVYGGPGAGKTTLMKNICRRFLIKENKTLFAFIVVIRFREIDYPNSFDTQGRQYNLFSILLGVFGITINFPEVNMGILMNEYFNLTKITIIDFLEESNILLLFDGFDEIPSNDFKKIIERDFDTLSLTLKKSRFIITSRNGEFKTKLTNTNTFEIRPLNDFQIRELAEKWLNNKRDADELFSKIKDSPYYDTTIRPLTLSHLCAIYERRKTIPSKPRYIYDLVIQLLLELWDEERGITRTSAYAEFYIEKKKEFLAHLSFCFSYELKSTIFSNDDIRKCYNKIYKMHNLPATQAKKIVNEIESHSGILIQNGYNSYQFSHKSLQEYLTAKFIFSQSAIPEVDILKALPNEIAIAASLSSSPNTYFHTFINLRKKFTQDFWNIFLDRFIEERPDFNDDPAVIVFLSLMSEELQEIIFLQCLIKLLSQTNLAISIPNFLKTYEKHEAHYLVTIYIHKEHSSKSLEKRNYLPGKIAIDNYIHDILKKY